METIYSKKIISGGGYIYIPCNSQKHVYISIMNEDKSIIFGAKYRTNNVSFNE
jgi:hypothetical protein